MRNEQASKVYTMGTDAMVQAMIEALPERYEMELVPWDMTPLIWALAAQVGFVTLSEEMSDRAAMLLSSVAETLGVEGV